MFGGTLEHQVFEEMRKPRFAGRFIRGTDLIPDHLSDDWCAMILDHNHLQVVLKREACCSI
jgi:hypothetical protein